MKKMDKKDRENWYFHNTKELMKKYRGVIMCIDEDLDELEINIEEIGDRFALFSEFAHIADINLSGAALENHMRCMSRNKQMITIINKAINKLRKYDVNGEEFYWILYLKYICDNSERCRSDNEIIDRMCEKGIPISQSTFYRRMNMAIEALSNVLWGYTSKDTIKIVEEMIEG